MIAPEGTRARTPKLGPFKKGAFHIAMQAQVPIVPVVLRGTGEVMRRGDQTIRSGEIQVIVLPPVDTSDWRPENVSSTPMRSAARSKDARFVARRAVAASVDEARDMNPDLSPEHRGGRGSPLLLLHGITATFRVWEPVFQLLEEQHEVIAPTLAGHLGASALAAGVVANIKLAGRPDRGPPGRARNCRPHVAGNSLGGWIALELARRGRARTVVAFSPPAAWCSARDLARVSALVTAGHAAAQLRGRGSAAC